MSKNAIDNISSFPADAERPFIRLDDDARWLTTIALNGQIDGKSLHVLAKRIKSDLLAIDGVIQVSPRVKRDEQINIDVPYSSLQNFQLSLEEIAEKVRNAAQDVPSGMLETDSGEIMMRTLGRRENALKFEDIVLVNGELGESVKLGEISHIQDNLQNPNSHFSYNGKPGMILYVYQSRDAKTLELAKQVHSYIEQLSLSLPDTVSLSLPYKRVERFKDRLSTLTYNGLSGLLLVVLVLGAFLTPRLALWVGISVPVVFIGAFTVLFYLDVSINMISLFAFIMSIGLVVDDAIIVGENIYSKWQSGLSLQQAASEGAAEMVLPVSVAVLTNIIAFIPLLMMTGDMGQYMRSLPIVAIAVFAVSYLDALFLLPAHLNSPKATNQNNQKTRLLPHSLERLRDAYYLNALKYCLKHKYTALSFAFGLLVLAVAWFDSGRIDFRWYPQVPSDRVSARLAMPIETPFEQTLSISQHIEQAGLQALAELGSMDDLSSRDLNVGLSSSTSSQITMTLIKQSQRSFTQGEFANLWREKVGDLPQAKSLQFDYLAGFGRTQGVYLDMHHENTDILEEAAEKLSLIISSFEGVFDVSDGLKEGKPLFAYTLTDEAKSLGISETSLGNQLRAAFFGVEALRFLRNDELVKVWVRLPAEEKNSLALLQDFVVRAPDGTEIPLSQAAIVDQSRTTPLIKRENGKKSIRIGGLLDPKTGNLSLINKAIAEEVIPNMKAQFPGLALGFPGTLTSAQNDSPTKVLLKGFGIASVVMFILVASLFRSYAQGLVVLLTVPFCIAAAFLGHLLMGFSLTSNSLFGMVALSGVVINGALVLTSKLNELISRGESFSTALMEASIGRFRAIVLTSLTTTIGLTPMLFETSEQALFLVPFAIALTFGSSISTLVILLVIPCCHAVVEDIKALWINRKRYALE